jgi:hypothetical protein
MTARPLIGIFLLMAIAMSLEVHAQEGTQSKLEAYADTLKGSAKQQARETLSKAKMALPDSVPSVKRVAKESVPKVDSVTFRYENGKMIMPEQLPSAKDPEQLKKKAEERLRELSSDKPGGKIPDYKDALPGSDAKQKIETKLREEEANATRLKRKSDSVQQVVKKGEDLVNQIKDGKIPNASRIYSSKTLKKLYDSLGFTKLDSALALASTKQEVSKEDLLQALHLSFPSGNEKSLTDPNQLAKAPELADAQKEFAKPDLSRLKLPTSSLQELPPIRGFQLPTDSIPFLDSLRKVSLAREKLKYKQEKLTQDINGIMMKKKPKFWDNAYFEGIFSFLKQKDFNTFQFSPTLGYRIAGNFSMGVGPTILVQQQQKWKIMAGYRAFAKYEIWSQRAYLQLEDMVDPQVANREYASQTRHSILAGGGCLLPISRVLAINLSALYRVNNASYSNGEISPWVIRLGISSRSRNNKKQLK